VIIGFSGSGKTVLANHILGFLEPDEGSVRLLGKRPSDLTASDRRRMGVVFQEPALFDALTVWENLLYPLGRKDRKNFASHPEKLSRLIESVGLAAQDLSKKTRQLSGGMRKRAALARAFAGEPELLVLDEPTTGLDPALSEHVCECVLSYMGEKPDRASVTITHDYLLAARLATSIYYLRVDGALEKIYDVDELGKLRSESADEEAYALELRHRLEENVEARFREQSRDEIEGGELPLRYGPLVGKFFRSIPSWAATAGRAFSWPGVSEPLRRFHLLSTLSVGLIMIAGLVVGIVSTWQSGLAMRMWGYDLLPRIVGVALCHHVGALFTGLFLAGRIGASIASEFGAKRLTRQHDALLSFGLSPERMWLAPVFYVSLVTFVVMTFLFEVFAYIGGLIIFTKVFHQKFFVYYSTFLADVQFDMWLTGIIKALFFGAAVAIISYRLGIREKADSEKVGYDTTSAVVWSLMAVIALDFVISVTANFIKGL
jgi:phospholipid/cholesterol/gamma-HCH transport system ATP-binding protein